MFSDLSLEKANFFGGRNIVMSFDYVEVETKIL